MRGRRLHPDGLLKTKEEAVAQDGSERGGGIGGGELANELESEGEAEWNGG